MNFKLKKIAVGTALVLGALSAYASDPIKIGSVLSVTGPAGSLGDPELKTLQLYVEELNKKGLRYKAIFIGAGKEDIIAEIKKFENVQVLNFIPGAELPIHYKMADIAVWPNSISTSMLDAAACAKPVIVSDSVYAYDEVNGHQKTKPQIIASFFETENHLDLVEKLEKFKNAQHRKEIGEKAMQYIMDNLSWDKLAEKRLEEYRKVL